MRGEPLLSWHVSSCEHGLEHLVIAMTLWSMYEPFGHASEALLHDCPTTAQELGGATEALKGAEGILFPSSVDNVLASAKKLEVIEAAVVQRR
jgi:hypothetical protein